MEDKLVSIAMSTYNGEKFLREQLDSIYNQTYKNIEVVVTDDCSVDATVNILEEYKQKYGLDYSVNERNLNFVKSFEKSISLCKGEYIALADQDDIWLPEKIETMIREIKDYSLVYSDAILVDEKGDIIANSLKKYVNVVVASREQQFKRLSMANFVTGCTMLFKKELLDYIIPFPIEAQYHDQHIALIASCINGIHYLNKRLTLYRQHLGNYTGPQNKTFTERLISFFPKKETKTNLVQFNKTKQRLKFYLNHKIYSNEEEKNFLLDMVEYYNSYLKNTPISFKRFLITYKHKDVLFINQAYLSKIIKVFLRLIG